MAEGVLQRRTAIVWKAFCGYCKRTKAREAGQDSLRGVIERNGNILSLFGGPPSGWLYQLLIKMLSKH